MSTMIKRYAVLTPFDLPEVVAGILALNHIDAAVVMTGSGAVVVRELAAPQYDEWDIRNIVGPDEFEEEDPEADPSDSAPTVAASLSKLSRFGVVLLDVDLGTDVGIEAGVSGTVRARRFLSGEAGEEISAGALLNVLDPLVEKLILGQEKPEDHDAILSSEVTTAMITKMARARNSRGEGKAIGGPLTDEDPEGKGSDGDSPDGGKPSGGSERSER